MLGSVTVPVFAILDTTGPVKVGVFIIGLVSVLELRVWFIASVTKTSLPVTRG